ncbi:MAG: S8 family serine peptidase, partial [Desulfobacterales bacterium]|nr:S8 family serine peptidase [Desulfobacterales bacterium]
MSVAASDKEDKLDSSSNYGKTGVDVMAPGDGIKSTVPVSSYTDASVKINEETYVVYGMAFAGTTDVDGITGILYDCGKGYSDEFQSEVSGNIALIERG